MILCSSSYFLFYFIYLSISRFVAHAGTPEKSEESDNKSPRVVRSTRRVVATIPPRETPPFSDMHDVSVMLKNLPEMESPHRSPELSPQKADHAQPVTPTPKSDLYAISKSLTDGAVESLMKLQMSAQQRTRTTLLTTRAVSFALL